MFYLQITSCAQKRPFLPWQRDVELQLKEGQYFRISPIKGKTCKMCAEELKMSQNTKSMERLNWMTIVFS